MFSCGARVPEVQVSTPWRYINHSRGGILTADRRVVGGWAVCAALITVDVHVKKNRYSRTLPEGGGALTGRLSVERRTAVTDRSATGISEAGRSALSTLLPRPWSLPTTLRPWSVRPRSTDQIDVSQVKRAVGKSRAGRRGARIRATPCKRAPRRGTHPGPLRTDSPGAHTRPRPAVSRWSAV